MLLGVVQGTTEFLPVSSSGHLLLTKEAVGISPEQFGLSFDVALHFGTLLAVVIFFRTALAALTTAWMKSIKAGRWNATSESRLAWMALIGTVPAGLVGYFLEDTLEDAVRSPEMVAVMLVVFSAPMVVAERFGTSQRILDNARVSDAILIGVLQAVALIPGVSRSGITISGGLLAGLRREDAASFAFLLAIPVISAATIKQSLDLITGAGGAEATLGLVVVGVVTAGLVGYATISALMHYLRTNSLLVFVAYRLVLGLCLFIFL